MFRNRIKRYLPSPGKIRSLNLQRFFGHRINDPRLWVINRRSVSRAAAVGLFCAYLPFPLQMIPAAFFAMLFKANLPVSVALVWISNPLTFVFVFTPPYLLGLALVGGEGIPVAELSMTSVLTQIKPLLIGSAIFGVGLGVSGYLCVQLVWRMMVMSNWKKREGDKRREGG